MSSVQQKTAKKVTKKVVKSEDLPENVVVEGEVTVRGDIIQETLKKTKKVSKKQKKESEPVVEVSEANDVEANDVEANDVEANDVEANDVEAEVKPKKIKKPKLTKEEKRELQLQEAQEKLQDLQQQLQDIKDQIKATKKTIRKLTPKDPSKKTTGGITMPMKISNELAKVLKLKPGTKVSIPELQKMFAKIFRDKQLNGENRVIHIEKDVELKKLFGEPDLLISKKRPNLGTGYHWLNLQSYLSRNKHIIKEAK